MHTLMPTHLEPLKIESMPIDADKIYIYINISIALGIVRNTIRQLSMIH